MIIDALLILLPAAAASGWYAAKRNYEMDSVYENERFNRAYLMGLNYLLNEQPDKAVDIFIKMLEVDSETVETHLALGTLFRRRGEVDRAIRIHQNLIARPQLPKQQRLNALLALGQDYLRAGLLDRAERLFLETIEIDNEQTTHAKRHLLDIYQQQKRWDAAIAIARKLENDDKEMRQRIANYYCEMAILANQQGQIEQAHGLLKQALSTNTKCVRASALLADIEFMSGEIKKALRHYQQVKEQNSDYLSEVMKPLVACYRQLRDEEGLINYLQALLLEFPRTSIMLALAEAIQDKQDDAAAIEFITQQLHQRPSLRGLQQLIVLQLKTIENAGKQNLMVLKELIDKLLKNKAVYRCIQCGYAGKILHWLCPGCRNWETMRPVLGVEGE